MMLFESWQLAEIAGPKRAMVFARPEVAVTMIQRAKRPILVVGHNIINDEVGEEAIKLIFKMANAKNISVVTTAHMMNEFIKRGIRPTAGMSLVDFANRLEDPGWKGLDGAGNYDLILFVGIPYSLGWLIFSSLKHFSSNLSTVSLDRFYQPNTTCSFSNLPVKKWVESLKIVVNALEGGSQNLGKSTEGNGKSS